MDDMVQFQPSKKLFIDIFTKDISLRDCILDLLDNSVDSYIRNKLDDKREIRLDISKDKICIYDNCGGIPYESLLNDVFRIGVEAFKTKLGTIGFYGIGLKRSIFKLGNNINFETHDGKDFCQFAIDVNKWLEDDRNWNLPLSNHKKDNLEKDKKPYTKIEIDNIKEETKESITTEFINNLKKTVQIYYTLFIGKKIEFLINGERQKKVELKIPTSNDYYPATFIDNFNEVEIKIICWTEIKKSQRKKPEMGKRGWNVFMNNRLVIIDDTGPITGWTGKKGDIPKFHTLFNDFRGVVLLSANDPSKLPINTQKNGFNTENKVYHYLLRKMIDTARPIIDFLSKKYDEPKKELEESENKLMDSVSQNKVSIESDLKEFDIENFSRSSQFKSPKIKAKKVEKTVTISYQKPKEKVDILKEILQVRSNTEVGVKTFDYYWSEEGLDE